MKVVLVVILACVLSLCAFAQTSSTVAFRITIADNPEPNVACEKEHSEKICACAESRIAASIKQNPKLVKDDIEDEALLACGATLESIEEK